MNNTGGFVFIRKFISSSMGFIVYEFLSLGGPVCLNLIRDRIEIYSRYVLKQKCSPYMT